MEHDLILMLSGGLWLRLDLQPITFLLPSVFILTWTGGKPGLGSEQPALFGSFQSQGRGQSPDTKPWGLQGTQVTLIYKMSLFKSQVQISLLIFFQKVGEEGAAIPCQQLLGPLPYVWHQGNCFHLCCRLD